MPFDVEVSHVSKKFGSVVAVDDVSLQIEKGEFFSMLGPSGCGKTTMLRMISGFEQPTSGEIRIEGEPMAGVPPFRRPTNLVFQHLALFPHLNVYENIAFGLRIKKCPDHEIQNRVRAVLDIVQLPGMERRKIRELSGGQQQRVAIARALVNQPAVLLLDEPLGPLDLKLRLEMQIELKRIQREVGTTFIYVTHDQGEAITMSNRIAVMRQGKLEQIGAPKEIYKNPRTRFVAEFIGEANLLEGVFQSGQVDLKGWRLKIHEKFPDGTKVTISVRPENIKLGEQLKELDNILKARVTDIQFKGSYDVYTLELDNGILLKALSPTGASSQSFRRGSSLQVGWEIDQSVAIV